MLSRATLSAYATTGTAVFRMVVSSDCMKNATATSHGRSCLLEADGGCEEVLMRRVPKLGVWFEMPETDETLGLRFKVPSAAPAYPSPHGVVTLLVTGIAATASLA